MNLQAFHDFLHNRQPPRPLSDTTPDDAIEFLLTLPSNKIEAVFNELSAATLINGSHVYKSNPFGSEIVRSFVKEYGEEKKKKLKEDDEEEEEEKENLFVKCLTSDSLIRLVVTGKFLSLATDNLLRFKDEEDKPWLFKVSYFNSSQCYVLTKGWRSYVKEKQLNAGDLVLFTRNCTESNKLFISFKKCDNGGSALEHSITRFAPILVIYCGDNQDSEETHFISIIFNELRLRGFDPWRYDLTKTKKMAKNQEMLYRSQIGIIIFSESFTCSTQCKVGFREVIKHYKANNYMTISVYYKVNSFENASTQPENSAQTTLKWMAIVLQSMSINRYQYMNGCDVMLVKNIVKDVFSLLTSETKWYLKRLKHLVENVLSPLPCSQSSVPHILGLWGMEGIGKTTISREIFITEGEKYDVCYFLPNFHEMCRTKGLSHLRDEFFSRIFGEEDVFIDSCDIKLSFMKDKFLDKKVLIVLDGVSNARDAEVLVGGFGWFSAGHTIILTSRNRQVLVECNAKELYKIPKLSKSESFQVCSEYATYSNKKLISELADYASGIPFALQVLGSSVESNNVKDHLRRLRQHPPIEIQDAFRRSFNGLDDNEKNIFLDMACFFRGEDKDHVVNILDGCGFLTDLGIYGLIDESLINLAVNKLEMPNIFQDMGRFVVCQEHKEAGKRSRLSDSNDIVDVLTNNLGTEAIEGIFFDVSGLTVELSSKVFERMYRLRLLKIQSRKICLPHGLHTLPDELRLLHWEIYPLGSLPRSFNPKNLVELNMPYSNMTKLWKGTKNLENLKRIILSHSRQLTKFPRLSKAKSLEHIDLEGCTSLVKVNSSILHLHKLTFLNLKDCSHLRSMPTTVDLESLEVLNLSGCLELEDFHGFSPNLKELYLSGTPITLMPSSVKDLTRLVKLDLEDCKRLLHLPFVAINTANRLVSSMAPTYKRHRLKRVIESVILNLRKRKREKSVYKATNPVQLGSESTSVNENSYKFFSGFQVLPERPGQPECDYYMKTGDCKFGNSCKFHHPKAREAHVLESFLNPSRPGQPLCALYCRTGNCSSGPSCIFDHPTLVSTQKNTTSMASKTQPSLALGAPLNEVVETSTTSMDSEAPPPMNLLGLSLRLGASSSELMETSTKKPRIYKNTTSMASKTLNPRSFSFYSLGASSSDHMETSTVSEITQASTFGRDFIDLTYEDEKTEMDDFVLVHPWDLNL